MYGGLAIYAGIAVIKPNILAIRPSNYFNGVVLYILHIVLGFFLVFIPCKPLITLSL